MEVKHGALRLEAPLWIPGGAEVLAVPKVHKLEASTQFNQHIQSHPFTFLGKFPTRQEGVVRFYVGIRVCDASTTRPHPVSRQSSSPLDPAKYPARAARQWVPPSIPPEQLASGSRRVSRQSGSPLKIPLSIPPERLARASRRVSRQSGSPVDPAEYPARAARH